MAVVAECLKLLGENAEARAKDPYFERWTMRSGENDEAGDPNRFPHNEKNEIDTKPIRSSEKPARVSLSIVNEFFGGPNHHGELLRKL